MIKIAIVGPESTGKSTLAAQLAAHFQTNWVPEYARIYLEDLGRSYIQKDLLAIARGQLELEQEYEVDTPNVLICDTNLLVIKIWSEVKYGNCDPWIMDQMKLNAYQIHLLTTPDIPWEFDPQREHPEKRERLFEIYKKELIHAEIPFVIINGNKQSRFRKAKRAIDVLIP